MSDAAEVRIAAPRTSANVLGLETAIYRSQGSRGSGPTLVLMHGSSPGACSELNWFRNFDALAAMGHDVLAFDQAGFGHTEAPQDHSIEFRYQHALGVLREAGVRDCVLLGNSMGGLLAVLMQHRVPRAQMQVRGMVLAAQVPHFEIPADVREAMQKHMARLAGVTPDMESVRRLTSNTLADHRNLSEALLQLRLDMLEHSFEAHLARGKAGAGFDSASVRAQKVDTPSLIVWGMNDYSLPIAIGLQAMQHFSHAQFMFLPRCGHWPQTEYAAQFNRMTHAFVEDLMAQAP